MTSDYYSKAGTAAVRARTPRSFGLAMSAEAVTFGIASYLHTDGHIPLGFTTITGEHFPGAVIPEATIGAVLAAGAVLVLARLRGARGAALGATAFGILGTLVGTVIVVTGARPGVTADLTYHGLILAALLVTFALLVRELLAGQRVRSR